MNSNNSYLMARPSKYYFARSKSYSLNTEKLNHKFISKILLNLFSVFQNLFWTVDRKICIKRISIYVLHLRLLKYK